MGSPRPISDVVREIVVTTYNSGNSVLVNKSDLREIGNRSRITEGFIAPIIRGIEASGCAVQRIGSTSFSVSPQSDGPVPFQSAREESHEAQRTGWRHSPSSSSNDVIGEDGNFL